MTYEEAKIKILEWACWYNNDFGCYHYERNICNDCEVRVALYAIEKQIKYRWHDLREDPFDLPSKTDLYLIAYKAPYNDKIYTNLEVYHQQEDEWGTPMGYEVVAWKELETLEGEGETE